MTEPVRLQKFLANAGVASRRKAEELILAGRVSKNGDVVRELGTRVIPGEDQVQVDGRSVVPANAVWIALHKPAGYLTSRGDPQGRHTIYELLPPEHRGLFYVGRLDYDTEGLILLTNDGDVAHRLQHPRYEVRRVYEVVVSGAVAPATRDRLLSGVQLEDGPARALNVQVIARTEAETRLQVTLAEGRKREVRRLFSALGHPVIRLKRVSFGPIELGDLPPARWRLLNASEVAALNS
jgi:23S rRNA pseudouridine2605 synthase